VVSCTGAKTGQVGTRLLAPAHLELAVPDGDRAAEQTILSAGLTAPEARSSPANPAGTGGV